MLSNVRKTRMWISSKHAQLSETWLVFLEHTCRVHLSQWHVFLGYTCIDQLSQQACFLEIYMRVFLTFVSMFYSIVLFEWTNGKTRNVFLHISSSADTHCHRSTLLRSVKHTYQILNDTFSQTSCIVKETLGLVDAYNKRWHKADM